MIRTQTNQVIALAGLTQCVHAVQQIAKRGSADESEMRPCIASVLKIDAEDVLDVYGGLENLYTGLKRLEKQVGNPDQVDPILARYVATLLFLERKLMRSPQKMATITNGFGVLPKSSPTSVCSMKTCSRASPSCTSRRSARSNHASLWWERSSICASRKTPTAFARFCWRAFVPSYCGGSAAEAAGSYC
jgi:hypothetical protein